MQPSRHLIWLSIFWVVLGFVAGLWSPLEAVYIWGGGLVCGVLLIDFLLVLKFGVPVVERVLPGRFASGVEQNVTIKLHHTGIGPLRVCCYDGLPEDAVAEEMPWSGIIPSGGYIQIEYPVTIKERGEKTFEPVFLRLFSPLRFWTRKCRSGESQTTRVYPNYEPVLRYALLAIENQTEQMGIVKKNRVGMSREFHQLRDYQLGDMLSQIDWKATSKRLSLITRDYQEQRDQTVILAVDCSRRMRAIDGDVPQFDHCLNAMLLLAYTALRQGDHVGILGVGGSDRWLSPVKGVQSMTTILNHLYDYQTTTSPSDFTEAAQRLLTRQRRRALVVLLTNVRGEDAHELVEPLRLIRQKHVTILANLQESAVAERMKTPVNSLDDAVEVGATAVYLEDRARMLGELRSYGVFTIDSQAKELPIALANAYLSARERV
jgi:uncharacterized protein (DUF58 family)